MARSSSSAAPPLPRAAQPPAAQPRAALPRAALFRVDGPICDIIVDDAIRSLMLCLPNDPDEHETHRNRRIYAAIRAVEALGPRDEIELMYAVQAVIAHYAALACWRLGMNGAAPNGENTRHLAAASAAVRTYDAMVKSLERRQARAIEAVPAAKRRAASLATPLAAASAVPSGGPAEDPSGRPGGDAPVGYVPPGDTPADTPADTPVDVPADMPTDTSPGNASDDRPGTAAPGTPGTPVDVPPPPLSGNSLEGPWSRRDLGRFIAALEERLRPDRDPAAPPPVLLPPGPSAASPSTAGTCLPETPFPGTVLPETPAGKAPAPVWTEAMIAETEAQPAPAAPEPPPIEGVEPDGSIVVPENPSPEQETYMGLRIIRNMRETWTEDILAGRSPKIGPLRPGDR
ncbi:MAG TPA: hypothetical protein VHB27_19350, partial [Rhodopila sp.]|nr:hypothetical protein [Rhodopila sp.]